MNALLPLAFPPGRWDFLTDRRDWLAIYRELEAEADAAADAVRAACAEYRLNRCPDTEAAYRRADHAYDAARLRFQLEGAKIVRAVRAAAGLPRLMMLASEPRERML